MNELWLYAFIRNLSACHATKAVSQRLGWKILWYIKKHPSRARDAWLEGTRVFYIII